MGYRAMLVLACWALLGPPVVAFEAESLEQRCARLEAKTPTEKDELRSKKVRFDRLSPEERTRLRNLHEQICQQPDAEKLHGVMIRYSDWLKSLPIDQRAELAGMDAAQRLQQIKRHLEQQERQRFQELVFRKLNPQDLEVIKKWFGSLVKRNVDSLRATLPPEVRERIDQKSDAMDVMSEIARFRREQPGEKKDLRPLDFLEITDADVAQLTHELSPEASRTLAEAPDKNNKLTVVKSWVLAAVYSGRWHRVSDEDLKRFLATRVDAATRDYLENLPRDEMYKQLRRLYYMEHLRSRWPPRGGPGGPGPPPWPPGFNPPPRKPSR